MNEFFNTYSLIICIVVLAIFVPLAVYVIASMTKQTVRMIEYGHEDESVKKYFNTPQKRCCLLNGLFRAVLLVVTVLLMAFSVCCVAFHDTYSDVVPLPKVVVTNSMATKNKKNTYLTENGLDNQLQVFDLIFIKKAPKEEDLKLYDVAVYEVDGVHIVHRIVEIREATATSPRIYIFQGDAVSAPDRPVTYEQIKGIYTGTKVPFIGSFIMFMQSSAGYLCALLIIIGLIAAPLVDRKIERVGEKRYLLLLSMPEDTEVYSLSSSRKTLSAGAKNFIALVRQDKVPFVKNLLAASEGTGEYLNTLHNELTAYQGVTGGVTVQGMVYQLNKKNVAKMTVKGNDVELQVFTPDGDYPPKYFNVRVKSKKDEKKVKKQIASFFEAKKAERTAKRKPVNVVETMKNLVTE